MNSKVAKIHIHDKRVGSVEIEKEGEVYRYPCSYLLSSMPTKDLIASLEGIEIPGNVRKISS